MDVGNGLEPVGLLVNVAVLASRGDVTETFRAARAGKLATRIRVRHMTPPLEGFDEGFDPGVAQRLKKSGGLSLCHFSYQRS